MAIGAVVLGAAAMTTSMYQLNHDVAGDVQAVKAKSEATASTTDDGMRTVNMRIDDLQNQVKKLSQQLDVKSHQSAADSRDATKRTN